ncbi:helix-turn-helix domain-containing protein [Propionicimonas sp.]|uniref:helix-turn-helix domain-containing protein n=1 Tax=Propionicimonas sp. TaxID=1955623 RepID=UPI0039E45E15
MALHSVSVILIEPISLFEFSVAAEVFGIDRSQEGIEFDFQVCGTRPGEPYATKLTTPLTIVPTSSLNDAIGSDLVIVAPTTPQPVYDEAILETLRAAHAAGSTILSLCSGSFALGAAGLLDGRPCTTHWMYAEEMRRRFPATAVDPSVLFVDAGDIITSAGTAAGVDACLHLVRRELGAAVASTIARRMVVPPQRDGGQQQFVETPIPACESDGLAALLEWAVAHLAEDHTIASLAGRATMSERTFARRFASETGTTPHKWLIQQRVLAARDLLERSDLAVEQIADRVGFNSAVVLRDHFRRATGLAPTTYRRRFGQ